MIDEFEKAFAKHANKEIAKKQSAYMRDQFSFLGIPKPQINEIEKVIFKQFPLKNEKEIAQVLKKLWEKPEREYQYVALSLAKKYKKLFSQDMIKTFEMMIREKSWWDTVDDLAANCVGNLVQNHPSLISEMDQWIFDSNLWIRRSALLFQLKWKDETSEKRLFGYIQKTKKEEDFFIRKAIGWVLREYSKTNQESVRKFLQAEGNTLSNLSVREAKKYID